MKIVIQCCINDIDTFLYYEESGEKKIEEHFQNKSQLFCPSIVKIVILCCIDDIDTFSFHEGIEREKKTEERNLE